MLDISEVNLDPVTAAAGKEAQKVCRHHMHVCIFVCREHGFNNGYKPFIFANKQSPSYKSLDKTLQIKGCNTHTPVVRDAQFQFHEEILLTKDISINRPEQISKVRQCAMLKVCHHPCTQRIINSYSSLESLLQSHYEL